MNEGTTRKLLRFSVFEADLDSGELFKKGQRVKLQGQPFDLLAEFLIHPGYVLTREQLKERLWPGDANGDFDTSLNRAINRIREVLGDSAESPHFVETLPRRGYRFIGTVSGPGIVEPDLLPSGPAFGTGTKELPDRPKRNWKRAVLAEIAVVALFLLVWLFIHLATVPARDLKLRQLTTNSSENPVWNSVISPDGKYLAYGDSGGIRLEELSTGQTHALPKPKALSQDDLWLPSAWFPDGTRMVATALKSTMDGQAIVSAWSLPVLGDPVLLRENAIAPSVSPDGSLIAFTKDLAFARPLNLKGSGGVSPWAREIWVMGPRGEDARKVVSSDGKALFRSVQWSPDNRRIAYSRIYTNENAPDVETISIRDDPGRPAVILPEFLDSEFCWMPDGRIVYTKIEAAPNNRNANLWTLKVDSKTGKPASRPRQVTNLPGFGMGNLSTSSDGKKLTFQSNSNRSDVFIGRLRANGALELPRRLTFDERVNLPFAWTLDSKSIVFTSDRTGVIAIYKQQIDQDLADLIPTGPEQVWEPRVTPDGSFIVYFDQPDIRYPGQSRFIRLMRVPVSGGARELVMRLSGLDVNLDCPIQPHSECVIEQGASPEGARTFISFDPLTGKRRELFRRKDSNAPQWTLSPDGAHIGAIHGNLIEIWSLTGQIERTIPVKGWPYLDTIDWTSDGNAVLVSHNGPTRVTLLRVSLEGQTQPLWEMKNSVLMWAIASPDGRYLAIAGGSLNSNAWLVENF